jgi:hypothetical protein
VAAVQAREVRTASGPQAAQGVVLATVSGSFRRSMTAVQEAVYALTDAGARVLSPADPRVVDQLGDFLFVASDRLRAIRPVQNRHLAAIAASDFLWVVAPDGYVGLSAAMEVGYAVASGVPICGLEAPADLTLRQYVEVVPDIEFAIARARSVERERLLDAILLDPIGAVESAHGELDLLATELTQGGTDASRLAEAAQRIERSIVTPLR